MMSADFLTLCDAIAEECRCSICKGYLCSPIRVLLTDGEKICGRCSPQDPHALTTRDSVLEDTLNLISFPCRFRKEGCTERSLFGQVISHEINCSYQIVLCTAADCNWKGTDLTLFDHIKEHKELVKEKAEIKLQLSENAIGNFIYREGFTFTIRYFYDCDNWKLNYCIAYNSYDNASDIAFKTTLINCSNSDFSINLKQINFVGFETVIVLDLNKFSEMLNNPDYIVIVFNFTVTQVNSIVKKLDLPACNKCYYYLIPPLFMLENKLVCYKCGERYSSKTPSINEELEQLLKQIDFPCDWRNCCFSGKYDVYKTHNVPGQIKFCKLKDCADKEGFKVSAIIEHYKRFHKAEYFVGNAVLKLSYSGERSYICQYTMKSGDFLVLQHLWGKRSDKVYVYTLLFGSHSLEDGRASSSTASILFEHQHCRRKPKPLKIFSNRKKTITLAEFPPCFKNYNEITVTVTIE